jgi:hypothetical protein
MPDSGIEGRCSSSRLKRSANEKQIYHGAREFTKITNTQEEQSAIVLGELRASVMINPSDLLRFHRRRRWIGGLELAEPLFFLLGLLFKVSLPLFELIVWFCQFVILLQV